MQRRELILDEMNGLNVSDDGFLITTVVKQVEIVSIQISMQSFLYIVLSNLSMLSAYVFFFQMQMRMLTIGFLPYALTQP